ncbi:MAG: polysaccharide deacetylase family protein [Desulfobacterales bacterium]|nr:polysaccharide deacetylase family protein [Desulfobacterales bacterium]
MYHSISNDAEDDIHPYYRINTSPSFFDRHMQFLYENSYKVIDLNQAVKILREPINQSTNQPINYVVITFDDGFRDFYTEAFPILQKYGYRATVFLPTAFIDNQKHKLKDKDHLNWDEVKELFAKGITFGSHTVSHPQLKNIDHNKIEYELRQSKEHIEVMLGREINLFSYPYKFPEEDKKFIKYLKDVLVKSGYEYCVTTKIGNTTPKSDCYFLKRIPVNLYDDLQFFNAKLEGAYNWLQKFQYVFKKFKNIDLKWKIK